MGTELNMPPEACPNGGVCLMIQPQIDEHADKLHRHEKALERIGSDLDTVKKDVHEIRVTLREKDQMMNFLRTVFLALLGIFASGVIGIVVQVGATVWWAGQLNSTIAANQLAINDHEQRLRSEELDSAARRHTPSYQRKEP